MKLLLMADGDVGQAVFDYLIECYPDDLAMVVTVADNALHSKACAAGIPSEVFRVEEGFIDALGINEPCGSFDLGVLGWWPKILRQPIIDVPKLGFINMHPSLLPYNRGKHYNFWAIVEQSPFGVTLHFVDSGVDTGDIIAQRSISYDWTDTGGSLYHRAQSTILDLFRATYPKIRAGEISRTPQGLSSGSFHVAKELEDASRIDLDAHYRARDLLNLLRARTFPGHPACCFVEDGQKYEVRIKITKELQA